MCVLKLLSSCLAIEGEGAERERGGGGARINRQIDIQKTYMFTLKIVLSRND